MSISLLIGALTTAVAAVLSAQVLNRWRQRRTAHLLFWGLGLALYVVAGLSEIVLAFGWSDIAFRMWYWSGALMIPPLLGQGTLHLLARRRAVAAGFSIAIVFVAYASLVWMFGISLDATKYNPGGDVARFLTESYRDILPASPIRRALAPILNGYGTVLLAGGAVYSAWLFLRKQILPNRVLGNVLIALGGVLPALGGTLVKLAEDATWLSGFGAVVKYVTILLSVVIVWLGFNKAVAGARPAPAPAAKGPA